MAANNSLKDVEGELFSHLKNLNEIDFSFNEFTKISAKVGVYDIERLSFVFKPYLFQLIEALKDVKSINFNSNNIFTVDNSVENEEYKWLMLFLANNQLTVITGGMLENFKQL